MGLGPPMLRLLEKISGVVRGVVYLGVLVVTPWLAVSALRAGDVVLAGVNVLSFALVSILATQRVRRRKENREGKP